MRVVYDEAKLATRLDDGEWLKLGEVAALAGIPRTTLNDWIKQGRVKVRYRKTLGGGQRRFNPEDVRRIIVEVKEEHSAEADD